MTESVALDGTLVQWGACRRCAVSIPLAPPAIWTDGRPLCFRCQNAERTVVAARDWLAARRAALMEELTSVEAQLRDYGAPTNLVNASGQEEPPASGTRARGVGGEKIDEKESPFSKYVRERVNTPGDDVFVEFNGSPRTDCQDCGVDWPPEERRFGQWRPHAPGCPALLQRSKEVGCPRCKEIEVALVNGVMLSHDGYPCTNQEERA